MTEQITQVGGATVEPEKRVQIHYLTRVTGSPQAIVSLHAHFKEVSPRRGRKTLAERIGEAYKYDLEPEEKGVLDRAAEQFGRRLSEKE